MIQSGVCMCILWQFIRYDSPLASPVNRHCCESGMLSAKHFSETEYSIQISFPTEHIRHCNIS